MHLGSLESTQEARVALGWVSNSYADIPMGVLLRQNLLNLLRSLKNLSLNI